MVEIGLDNDLNEYSLVCQKRTLQDIAESQKKLAKLAKESPCPLTAVRGKYGEDYIYDISTCSSRGEDVDKIICEFNTSFNRDLFEIANSFGKFSAPRDIRKFPFYMLGLRTVCKSANDPGLKTAREPYSKTGFWVVPNLIGYPCCLFPPVRKQKSYS